jgi:hypothetical protein
MTTIRNFATMHRLTLEGNARVLGKGGSRISGRRGYIFELTEEPGTLRAVLRTTGLAEKWRTRIRLLFSGCWAKDFPKSARLDRYDAFSLVVRFDPDNETQTRIIMAAAQL